MCCVWVNAVTITAGGQLDIRNMMIVGFSTAFTQILVVLFTRVDVSGWFWGYALPPVALLVAWAIYDLVDDRIEARTSALYDSASRRLRGGRGGDAAASAPSSPQAARGRRELKDGLTDEQRRLFDEL